LIGDQKFEGRAHFFAADAEAMRRVLMDRARDRKRLKRGGPARRREDLDLDALTRLEAPPDDLLDLDAALARLEQEDARAAAVVKLRVFAGLSLDEAAAALGVVRRTAERDWAFARAWLFRQLSDNRCHTAEPDGA
jgi:RNA polymerase sigma factor (TIGR02999 family)